MFETFFLYPSVVRRHQDGPLAAEREHYLKGLAAQGAARATLLKRASFCLCVAREVTRWPSNHMFERSEIVDLASAWGAKRTADARARGPRWPQEQFCLAATDFLGAIGRLRCHCLAAPGEHDQQLDDFIAARRQGPWQSDATCQAARWQVVRFLSYLRQQGVSLGDVDPRHIDDYFRYMAARWGRASLRTSSKMLRSWFAYCGDRGWTTRGLDASILLPRIYRHEGLPMGPTWDEIGRMIAKTAGDEPIHLRDHAILQLLCVYGLRSGEVRRLTIDDFDWQHTQIHIVRSKSAQQQTLPLEPSVGNAVARYLRHGRPTTSKTRIVFLTVRAPHRPLSTAGLYDVVNRYLSEANLPSKGRGPHGLRHACARHLVESGRSFKEVGDHLGHRSPEATRIYAKVDLTSLRRVALSDLGGLS
jgi:integrase/recombinase XerD